jgi:hypothetical protein
VLDRAHLHPVAGLRAVELQADVDDDLAGTEWPNEARRVRNWIHTNGGVANSVGVGVVRDANHEVKLALVMAPVPHLRVVGHRALAPAARSNTSTAASVGGRLLSFQAMTSLHAAAA